MEIAPTKTLWLLRHATAEDEPPAGGEDHDRMLSSVGIAQAEALGAAIVAGEISGQTPQTVLVSSASRTRGTAMLTFSGLGPDCEFSVDQRIYPAIPDDLLAIVAETDDAVDCLGIVGHNPTIAWFGVELVSTQLVSTIRRRRSRSSSCRSADGPTRPSARDGSSSTG